MLAMIGFLLLQLAATAAPPELMDDPHVLDYCRSLVAKSAAEEFDEQGAFVVRAPEGHLYFVVWPSSGNDERLRWRGRVPEGTIAIVHTHRPMYGTVSKFDAMTARRTGVPVYILTPRRIVKTTGEATEVVRKGKW